MYCWATVLAVLVLGGCNAQPSTDARQTPSVMTATVVSYESNSEWDHFQIQLARMLNLHGVRSTHPQ